MNGSKFLPLGRIERAWRHRPSEWLLRLACVGFRPDQRTSPFRATFFRAAGNASPSRIGHRTMCGAWLPRKWKCHASWREDREEKARPDHSAVPSATSGDYELRVDSRADPG